MNSQHKQRITSVDSKRVNFVGVLKQNLFCNSASFIFTNESVIFSKAVRDFERDVFPTLVLNQTSSGKLNASEPYMIFGLGATCEVSMNR